MRQPVFMVKNKKNPPMFIKLRAERFSGRLTVQERGAGLGDIFTQNTLSAIKAVCQVFRPRSLRTRWLGGRLELGGGDGGWWRGAIPSGDHHTDQSSAAGRPQQFTHMQMTEDS